MKRRKVGIIGCGAIGSEIARWCVGHFARKFRLEALYDIAKEKAAALSSSLKKEIVAESAEEVFNRADLIVECACADVSRELVEMAIKKEKEIMVMSVGGLVDSRPLLEKARERGIRVFLPSGAVCGIDGLKAAALSGIKEVTLTTRKPPRGLEGAPYLKQNKIDIKSIKNETLLFEGSASEAVRGFPKNVNVSSILGLAGPGAEKVTVRIITSPAYTKNTHEVKIRGDFGEITARTENLPSEKNPKTSKLAYLSAIATLKGIAESVKIGT